MGTLHTLPVRPGRHAAPSAEAASSPAEAVSGAAAGKPRLAAHARLDVEQARQFLMGLDGRTAAPDGPAPMFLLGRLAEHAQALLDVIDAAVTL